MKNRSVSQYTSLLCKSKWMRPDGTTLQDPDTELNLLGNSIGGAPVCSRPQGSHYISELCTTLNLLLDLVRVEAYGRLPLTVYVRLSHCGAIMHLKVPCLLFYHRVDLRMPAPLPHANITEELYLKLTPDPVLLNLPNPTFRPLKFRTEAPYAGQVRSRSFGPRFGGSIPLARTRQTVYESLGPSTHPLTLEIDAPRSPLAWMSSKSNQRCRCAANYTVVNSRFSSSNEEQTAYTALRGPLSFNWQVTCIYDICQRYIKKLRGG